MLLLAGANQIIASNHQPPTLQKALEYRNEDPKKALDYAMEALEQGLNAGSPLPLAQAFRALSLISISQSNLTLAREHLDSAKRYALLASNPQEDIELLKAHVTLLQKEGKPREARNALQQGLRNAKKGDDTKLEVQLLLHIGEHYRQLSRFDESQEQLLAALRIASREGYRELIAQSFQSLGSTFWQQSSFEQALRHYSNALTAREELRDTAGLIATRIGLALAYRDMGRFAEARRELTVGLNLSSAIGDTASTATLLNQIGSLAFRSRNYSEALDYYQQSLYMRRELGYLSSTASSLENIARVYRESNRYEEAQESLSQAIEIFDRLGAKKQVASTYNEKGTLYSQQGQLAEALKFYLLSLKFRQELGNNQDIARSLTNIGLTYRKIGSLNNALRYFEQAQELIPEGVDPVGASYIHVHTGNTKREMGQPEAAISNFNKSLQLRRTTGNQQLIAQSLRSISLAYSDLKDYDRAELYLNRAQDIYQERKDKRGLADMHNELGNLYQLRIDPIKALENFQRAATLYEGLNDRERLGLCLRKIGEIQTQQGQYPQALANLTRSLELGKEIGNAKLVELTLLAFHTYFSLQGDYRKALEYFSQHVTVRDSLMMQRQQEMIWQVSMEMELGKKIDEIRRIEDEVETLRAEALLKGLEFENQRIFRNFLIVVTILVMLIAIGSIYGYIAMRRTNRKLAESEQTLRTTVVTKDKLFSIIAHDLRSPFTALMGLTEVLASRAKGMSGQEVEEYGELIHESSGKLLGLIEALMLWSRSQTGKINLNPKVLSVHQLVEEIIQHLDLQAKPKGLKVLNGTQPHITILADYDTMSAVIRNLVSNAIKFTDSGGTVTVSAVVEGEHTLISVADTGVGIPPEVLPKLFNLEGNVSTRGTNQETGTGLGLIVCKEFTERNGGSISVSSVLGKGTTFTVRVMNGQPV